MAKLLTLELKENFLPINSNEEHTQNAS